MMKPTRSAHLVEPTEMSISPFLLFLIAVVLLSGGLWFFLFPGQPFIAALLGFAAALVGAGIIERVLLRRWHRAMVEESRYRAWLARVNQLAGRKGYDWHFNDSAAWRGLYAEGLSPGESILRVEGEDL